MSVSARSAIDLLDPADVPVVDLRRAASIQAGTFPWTGPAAATGWHRHPCHQLEYALRGVAEVETPYGHYLLPPHQAIWIPADLPHATTLHDVQSVSVFFDPVMLPSRGQHARILPAAPVIREMIMYGQRWPISRPDGTDSAADQFFAALAHVVDDWLDRDVPLCLPTTTDPLLAEVIAYTNRHLATVTVASVCRVVGLSQRTLRRRFPAALGMTWRTYVQQSQVLRAMSLLATGDRTITDVATAVGFASPSAFTRAFQAITGESPSAYGRRVRARP